MGAEESARSLIERAAQRISDAFALEPEAQRPEDRRADEPAAGTRQPTAASAVQAPAAPLAAVPSSAPSHVDPPAAEAPAAPAERRSYRPVQVVSPPSVEAPSTAPRPARRRSQSAMIDLDRLRQGGFIVPDDAPTRVAEEFRIVKRQLLRKALPSSPDLIPNGNLILVTSTQPGEGKTFCSINLALSIASERDLTVMLVDADVARPQLLSALDIDADKGLIDLLVDDRLDVADCLLRTNIDNLTVLPAGRPHPGATELLSSEKMAALLQEMARRYHDRIVIFDSSPVLASSAPGVLAARMGQIMFVVEADRTRETQVMEALSLISDCRNISMLLNKSRFTGGKVRFGSYYEYYRS
jgi:protein-tyrosine kinase